MTDATTAVAARGAARRDSATVAVYALGGICLTALLVGLSIASVIQRPSGFPVGTPDRRGWTISLTVCLAAYVLAFLLVRRSAVRIWAVTAIAIAIQLAPLSGPLLFSTDVYTYWTYGRMEAIHGANPYADSPLAFSKDPPFPFVGEGLANTTSIYGPGFTALSSLHARVSGNSPRVAAFGFRAAMALAVLALVCILSRWAPRPALAVVLFGWSPLVAVHAAGGGHNDALMLLFAVPAVLCAARGRGLLAGLGWASSLAIKSATLVLLPLEIVALLRRRNPRTAATFIVGLGAGAAAIGVLATLLYGTAWFHLFNRAQVQARQISSISSVFVLEQHGFSQFQAKAITAAVLVAGYLWLLRWAVAGRARLGLASSLVVLTQSWLVPWYGFWALSFSAAEEDNAGQFAAVVISVYLLWDTLRLPHPW